MSLRSHLPGRQPSVDPRTLDRATLLKLGADADAQLSAGARGLLSLNKAEKVALLAYWRASGRGSILRAFLHGLQGRPRPTA